MRLLVRIFITGITKLVTSAALVRLKKIIIIIMAVVSRLARERNTSGYMENIIHNKTYRFTINIYIYIRFEKT